MLKFPVIIVLGDM